MVTICAERATLAHIRSAFTIMDYINTQKLFSIAMQTPWSVFFVLLFQGTFFTDSIEKFYRFLLQRDHLLDKWKKIIFAP